MHMGSAWPLKQAAEASNLPVPRRQLGKPILLSTATTDHHIIPRHLQSRGPLWAKALLIGGLNSESAALDPSEAWDVILLYTTARLVSPGLPSVHWGQLGICQRTMTHDAQASLERKVCGLQEVTVSSAQPY